MLLCYYAHRPVTFEGTQKTHNDAWLLDFYLHEMCRSPVINKYCSSSLNWAQVLSCNPKESVMVLSFLDPPGIIHCKAGMPSKGDRDTQVSTGLWCQCPWPPSKPPFTDVASCQIWSHYTRELTISQPLWAELFPSFKGQSHISCLQCKITSDM